MPHAAVSEQQRHRVKHLRRAMTRAEILLWRYLKAHRLDGLAFRRQAPIGGYTNLEGVLIVIRETAAARVRSAPPSLSLPRKGGGNPQTAAVPSPNAADSQRDHL